MKKIALFMIIIIVAGLMFGCGGQKNSTSSSVTPAVTGTAGENKKDTEQKGQQSASDIMSNKITVLLDWTPNTNHTGMFVARDKGFYKEQGIEVEFVSADSGNGLELLASGKGDVAVSFQEQITAARTADKMLPVKAIATILQSNTSGFASLKSKGIKTVKDFEGKTYGSWGTDIENAFLKTIMKKNNADFSKLKVVTTNALDSLTMLKKDADIAWIYYGWDGIAAELKGEQLDFKLLKDLDSDIEFYSPLLAANDLTIFNKPQQLKKFLQATKKGYELAAKSPDEAANILCAANKDLDVALVKKSQSYLKDHLLDKNGSWGSMEYNVWNNFTVWMLRNEIIKKARKADDFYTNELLK